MRDEGLLVLLEPLYDLLALLHVIVDGRAALVEVGDDTALDITRRDCDVGLVQVALVNVKNLHIDQVAPNLPAPHVGREKICKVLILNLVNRREEQGIASGINRPLRIVVYAVSAPGKVL